MSESKIDVSIIIPVHNEEKYLDECFEGITKQTFTGKIEVCIYNDRSTDKSDEIIKRWIPKFTEKGMKVQYSQNPTENGGVAFAKNRCIEQSYGEYLCFQDADDVMYPERIQEQYAKASEFQDAIVGSYFERMPKNATRHYTEWMNALTDDDLLRYQYREVLIIQPTWFMHRSIYDKVGGYKEDSTMVAFPEDLDFYHRHLDMQGKLKIVPKVLLMYRMHENNTCWKIPRRTIMDVKLKAFERRVISKWKQFSIWGAGRDGRNFVNDLSPENRKKVVCFGDVDENKIGKNYENPLKNISIPVVHFSELKPPVVCCVAMGRTQGVFEKNVKSMKWIECVDYWHFN